VSVALTENVETIEQLFQRDRLSLPRAIWRHTFQDLTGDATAGAATLTLDFPAGSAYYSVEEAWVHRTAQQADVWELVAFWSRSGSVAKTARRPQAMSNHAGINESIAYFEGFREIFRADDFQVLLRGLNPTAASTCRGELWGYMWDTSAEKALGGPVRPSWAVQAAAGAGAGGP
jgi:hypothetical protein